MNNKDKMLQLVLSDDNLMSYYEYNAKDYPTIPDALQSDNAVVVAVAKIINSGGANQKSIYNEVFNYLKNNLL